VARVAALRWSTCIVRWLMAGIDSSQLDALVEKVVEKIRRTI
jgi:hypothetical protein